MVTNNSITMENKTGQLLLPLPCFACNGIRQDMNISTSPLEDFFFPTSGLFTSVSVAPPEAGCHAGGSSAAKPVACGGKGGGWMGFQIRIGNSHLKRLLSGAIAGIVSRTAVAPLETIRTHLMVGSNGNSTGEVFDTIIKTEGWKGLFRGNFVNVIRVAPSKAVEVFCFDLS
jgi:Mitochondrial carrier protein